MYLLGGLALVGKIDAVGTAQVFDHSARRVHPLPGWPGVRAQVIALADLTAR
jgi:hypothetical protein